MRVKNIRCKGVHKVIWGKILTMTGCYCVCNHFRSGTSAIFSSLPLSVSEYSTLGGDSGDTLREINPSRSSTFRVSESVFGLIAPIVFFISLYRSDGSLPKWFTMQIAHFLLTTSMIPWTGQMHSSLSSHAHFSVGILRHHRDTYYGMLHFLL